MQEQIILKSHLQIKNLFALKQETISLIICPADLKASDKKFSTSMTPDENLTFQKKLKILGRTTSSRDTRPR